jgi:hypothetical protein
MIRVALWMPNYKVEKEKEVVSRPFMEMELVTDEATF